jgi:transposase-like protein
VTRKRPALFRGRHFEDVIILLCVRWYLRYSLTYRDLEEIMAERGLSIDHVTIWRWVQRYAPVLNQRIRRELRRPNRSWRVDETYVKVAGDWAYLYRAVDSTGETIEFMLSPKRDLIAAKLFLRLALSGGGPPPRVINVDGHPAYASAVAELKQCGELGRRCRCRTSPYVNNVIEIVFTQMTKPNLLAVRMGGDYVTDLDFALGHKDGQLAVPPSRVSGQTLHYPNRRGFGGRNPRSMNPTEPTPPADRLGPPVPSFEPPVLGFSPPTLTSAAGTLPVG